LDHVDHADQAVHVDHVDHGDHADLVDHADQLIMFILSGLCLCLFYHRSCLATRNQKVEKKGENQ